MKKSVIYMLLSTLLFAEIGRAETAETPLNYLTAMTHAHKTLNYEQYYLLLDGEEAVSWRYRHAQQAGKEYAQLLGLDGAREEIILQENQVGYFGDFQPFSLHTHVIWDNLPSVIYTDFTRLEGYSFMDMGRARVANRVARVVRIVPNDEFRYQYTVWIDEENHLLLKSELLDRDKNVLEEFRVLQNTVDDEVLNIIEPINALALPALIPHKQANEPLAWQPKWIPKGFRNQAISSQNIAENSAGHDQVESQLYSDGLFSFTVYLADNQGVVFDDQFWRNGKTSIYSQTVGDKDVIIVGEIPLISARHIVQEIERNRPLAEDKQR